MQPERASEIQQALATRGYLHQEPNGLWDDETRAAMKRFQENFQFPATGLPEAKSLMKLGLGPHPLAEELDPEFQTHAEAVLPAGPDSSTPDTSSKSEY